MVGSCKLRKVPTALTTRNRPFGAGHPLRRGGRVVDGSGLENRRTRKGTGGSNPSLSARFPARFVRFSNTLETVFLVLPFYCPLRAASYSTFCASPQPDYAIEYAIIMERNPASSLCIS